MSSLASVPLGAASASRRSRRAAGSSTRPPSFRARGFAGTSVAAIAARAEVSRGDDLSGVRQQAGRCSTRSWAGLRGGERGTDPGAGGSPRRSRPSSDQHEQVRLCAADIVRRLERVGPLMTVVDAAAPGEPAIAELQRGIDRARRVGLAEFVDALSARGPLAVGRDVGVDTVWALASPELQQLLHAPSELVAHGVHVMAGREPRPSCLPVRRRAGRGSAAGRRTARPARS